MSEKTVLDRLFKAGEEDSVPQQKVTIKRIGLSFTMKGLREAKVEQLQQRFTTKEIVRGEQVEKLDRGRFNRAVIAEATVAIGDDAGIRWEHPELLSKYKASGAEQVIKKVLLAGEITQLADTVLDLSGYYNVNEDELKNASESGD